MTGGLFDINFDRVGTRYRLLDRIGSGAFGDVYRGIDIYSRKEVAVKIEYTVDTDSFDVGTCGPYRSQLEHEYHVYKALAGCLSIPQVLWFGTECDYDVIVSDLLGPSLQDIFTQVYRHKFGLRNVLLLADKMLSQLECIHSHNLIHRDIKPDHFLFSIGEYEEEVDLYIIDFGLVNRFRNPISDAHIPYRDGLSLIGNTYYCSINAHRGIEQSRRDDLESLAYVLLYFMRGYLPWQGRKFDTDDDLIMNSKATFLSSSFFDGLPVEFRNFLEYTRSLAFDETPDYDYMRLLFGRLYCKERFDGQCVDSVFDRAVGLKLPSSRASKGKKVMA